VAGFDEELSTRVAAIDEVSRVRLTGAEVEVIGGADAGARAAIDVAGVTIGAGTGCDVRLSDTLASRRHCELRATADGVLLRDLGSKNGTYFAGARVRELLLLKDAVLSIGQTTLGVRLFAEKVDVPLSPRRKFGDAIAESAAMRHVFALLERAAKNDVTVLFEGDSGTGKDVLARALHQESARRDGPFVVVDCGALPDNLVESELFGHEKGAFTGAQSARPGAFEQAHEGTLFLDEIGELPIDAQPKLLRALENRSFRRIGGTKLVNVNVRVVAATNRRLREAVRRREFREDLFYRLAVVNVAVPRLADRTEDIAPIAEVFLRRATGDAKATLPPDLVRLLMAYAWPGNARELRNVVERFATFERADASLLFGGEPASGAVPSGEGAFDGLDALPYHDGKRRVIEAFHRAVLPRVVERADGSIARAAELLGLPRPSLYRMLRELKDGPGDDDER
jgi:transcriptional regulator with PAS, ATPase and Fis domain